MAYWVENMNESTKSKVCQDFHNIFPYPFRQISNIQKQKGSKIKRLCEIIERKEMYLMSEKCIIISNILLETSTSILISIGVGSGCDRGGIEVYKWCQLCLYIRWGIWTTDSGVIRSQIWDYRRILKNFLKIEFSTTRGHFCRRSLGKQRLKRSMRCVIISQGVEPLKNYITKTC